MRAHVPRPGRPVRSKGERSSGARIRRVRFIDPYEMHGKRGYRTVRCGEFGSERNNGEPHIGIDVHKAGHDQVSDQMQQAQGEVVKDGMAADEEEERAQVVRRIVLNMRQIFVFAVPILMVPLADPILSLIDTIFLGHFTGSLALASLGPCTLLFNFAFYSFTALTIATVSILGEKLRKGQEKEASKALSTSLLLGAVGGALITLILSVFGARMLAMTGCDPVLLPLSEKYLRIRAFAAPAAIVTSVAQAGFLSQRDSKTPLRIVVGSIIFSALGDLVLIGGLNFGVEGAAWTTLGAQIFSATRLLRALKRSRVVPSLVLPTVGEIVALLKYVSTLGIFYVSKTGSYLILQASATRLPALSLAAHQPVMQLWGLCSFTSAPLEQASLAFLPIAKTLKDKHEMMGALLATGAILGVVCSTVAVGVPTLFPFLLTSDKSLWVLMGSVWKQGMFSMLCCGLDVTSTGILLANRDTGYVAKAMVISLCILIAFFYGQPFLGGGSSLSGVWWGLAAFFLSRVVQSFPRVVCHHF
eukprot:jgi/Picsp_1/5576/NSC_02935-R1_enhanced disease susceptibility